MAERYNVLKTLTVGTDYETRTVYYDSGMGPTATKMKLTIDIFSVLETDKNYLAIGEKYLRFRLTYPDVTGDVYFFNYTGLDKPLTLKYPSGTQLVNIAPEELVTVYKITPFYETVQEPRQTTLIYHLVNEQRINEINSITDMSSTDKRLSRVTYSQGERWSSEQEHIYFNVRLLKPIELSPSWFNSPPTLTLTNPTDNQTLSEGNTMLVEGSVTDIDINDTIYIKCKINNGNIFTLASGTLSNNNFSFSQILTLSNKRLMHGTIDITEIDLVEFEQNTIEIWAEDNQGGTSPIVSRKFMVVYNGYAQAIPYIWDGTKWLRANQYVWDGAKWV